MEQLTELEKDLVKTVLAGTVNDGSNGDARSFHIDDKFAACAMFGDCAVKMGSGQQPAQIGGVGL